MSEAVAQSLQSWRKILAQYQSPDSWRSWWQVINSVVPFLALWVAMYFSLSVSYWLTLVLSLPTAGFTVRIFILFHDCGHGSFFKSQKLNDLLGFITGVLTFTPYFEWKHNHAIHHATAGNLDKRGVGDVLTLTVEEYLALPWWKKVGYRILRNPLILFTIGSFIVFAVTHRFWGPGAGKRERASVIWTNLVLAAVFAPLMLWLGWREVLLVQLPILFFASSAGVWLFYVQHNFEGTYWERKDNWDFLKAGLEGSSFYKLPAVFNWFTGNIGFHHIHHLAPKIPNYKLPWAHRENPVFQVEPLTIRKSLKSLGFRLWDEQDKCMVGYSAVKVYRKHQSRGSD